MNLDNKWIYPVLVLLFFLVGLVGSPFKHLESSGHFHLSVLKSLDPELFRGDEVAEGLGRFTSSFYPLLAFFAGKMGAGPEDLESILHALYVPTRLLTILVILALIRSLGWERRQEIFLFVLFIVWCSHRKGIPVGGVGVLEAGMTHREIVFLILIGAVVYAFRGSPLFFWALLGLGIFCHATRTVNFFFVTVPPLLLLTRRPGQRFPWHGNKHALGLAIFLGSAALFYLTMAPESMSGADGQYFLREKGRMNHISPFNQPPFGWLKILSVALLAVLSYFRFLRSDPKATLLAGFVVSGTVFGLLRSLQAVSYKMVLTAQLVPLRTFLWVWFFAFLLLAMAAVRSGNVPMRMALLGVLFLSIQDSLWLLAWTFMALGYFFAEKVPALSLLIGPDKVLRIGTFLCVLAMIIFWVLGDRQPFESFRDPFPVAAGLLLVASATMTVSTRLWLSQMVLAGLIGSSLLNASRDAYRRFDQWYGSDWVDWTRVGSWCQNNTAKEDLFVTPVSTHSFRNVALRTTLSEVRSELVWVNPAAYRRHIRYAESLREIREREDAGLEDVFCAAEGWGVRYVIVNEDGGTATEPVYRQGRYSVFAVPDDACS